MKKETVVLGTSGRLVIPLEMRKALGVDAGDQLVLELDDTGLRISTPAQALRRLQAYVRRFVPAEVSLADELIAERRLEAAREVKD